MKTSLKIVAFLMLAAFSQTGGIAQPSNPENYCQWMGRDSFRYKLSKVCTGTILSAGRVGVYPPGGYTHVWSTGATTPWFTFPGAGLYWVDITKDGCTGRDTIDIVYVTPPKVNLGNDTTLCLGDTLVLDAGNQGASFAWNSDTSTNQSKVFVVRHDGKYRVRVTVPGCSSMDTIEVKYKSPSSFSFGPDKTLCEDESVSLNPGITDARYLWRDGSTKPFFILTKPGTYSVQITDACGILSDTITFSGVHCKLYVPNAFTPNNDGKNDVFKVEGFENLSFFRFKIYNRWGTEVFSSSLPAKGWDGFLDGRVQPTGVYVWVLEYQKKYSPEKSFQRGTVMLIR